MPRSCPCQMSCISFVQPACNIIFPMRQEGWQCYLNKHQKYPLLTYLKPKNQHKYLNAVKNIHFLKQQQATQKLQINNCHIYSDMKNEPQPEQWIAHTSCSTCLLIMDHSLGMESSVPFAEVPAAREASILGLSVVFGSQSWPYVGTNVSKQLAI